jgi:regulator of sigma E protease
MQFLETLFYFVITLGVLVFVHELGHFLAAKLSGMRVDRFSLGFPPRAFGKKIGDTDYCVSWLPIGGYVKIAGMIDESFDTEHLSRPPEPWEFRARPIWQRMFVISAGVIMNLLLAVVIFWGINYTQGKVVRETTEIGYVAQGSPASTAGLRPGDRILQINGKTVDHWGRIAQLLYIEEADQDITMTVVREKKEIVIHIPRSSIPDPDTTPFGIASRYTEVVIQTVDPGKPADQLGLKPRDVLLTLNGTSITFSDKSVIDIVKQSAGKPLAVEWKRDNHVMSGVTTPTADGIIGISFVLVYTGPSSRIQYSLLGALPEGIKDILTYTKLSAQQIWQIVVGKRAFSQSVGGPIRIAQLATQSAEMGLVTFLGFMALLSISLAILNILPFPALDGGHLLFLLYEGIFRREIPVRIKLGLQKVGFVLLLAFMAFVVYNDIINF